MNLSAGSGIAVREIPLKSGFADYLLYVDLIAIVRHALHPAEPLVPIGVLVEQRYGEWLAEQEQAGVTFNADQRKWLDAIRDHIANSLSIDQDDFEFAPFSQLGGLGKAHQLFGDRLMTLIEELNARLAA